MKPRTRAETEAHIATTRLALDGARENLTAARRAFGEAEDLYISKGSSAAREKKRDAADEMDRRVALERRADEAHQSALVELAALERAEKLERLNALRKRLADDEASVAHYAAEFVALDRATDERVMALAADRHAALAVFAEVEALASELRVPFDPSGTLARPDLARACTTVRRAVTAARQKERRDPLAPHWLSDSPDAYDWRLRSMSHDELVEHAKGVALAERFAAAARDASVFVDGANATLSMDTTTTEEKTT